jgi:hypothetical protein
MTTPGFDVTHTFISAAPRSGQAAGYTTGSGGIAWSTQDWAAHPGALHIDQDPGASDHTADILDSEAGAVTPGSPLIAEWAKKTLANYHAGVRPGQRSPAIYMSEANVAANVNALISGGITSGIGLFVADWNWTDAEAIARIKAAAGPFPIIGVQYADAGAYDRDEFSTAWLAHISGQPPVPVPPPPPGFSLSVTPHLELSLSFEVAPAIRAADHYVITFTPARGSTVTIRPSAQDVPVFHVMQWVVPASPGVVTVAAIVDSKPVQVGTFRVMQ